MFMISTLEIRPAVRQYLLQVLCAFACEYNTSIALWKQHVNLLLQSFRSVRLGSSSVLIMKIIVISIVSTDEDSFELKDRKLCNNKFRWCFHKAELVISFILRFLYCDFNVLLSDMQE